MGKLFLTDIDDVVVDWCGAFEDWMDFMYKILPASPLCHSQCKLADSYGMDWDTINKYVFEFNTSPHFKSLSFIPGAVRTLVDLRKEGYTIVGITKCGRDKQTQHLRRYNMGHLFDEIHFVNFTENKSSVLELYSDAPYFDDNAHHVVEADELGLSGYLFNHASNMIPENNCLSRVTGWQDIRNLMELDK